LFIEELEVCAAAVPDLVAVRDYGCAKRSDRQKTFVS
jgi:hypothetical protein